MKTHVPLWSNLAEFFIEWEMFQTSLEKQNTHFMFSAFFLNRAVYETMWKIVVEPDGPHMRI
jgi:hypothetical protein